MFKHLKMFLLNVSICVPGSITTIRKRRILRQFSNFQQKDQWRKIALLAKYCTFSSHPNTDLIPSACRFREVRLMIDYFTIY